MPSSHLIDLSHTVEDGVVTYPGLPAPLFCDFLSREASRSHYAPGTEFQIGKIEMVSNTGTYLDTPFHRYEGGKDLSEIALDQVVELPVVLVRAPNERGAAIDASAFDGLELAGKAVLVHTGWSKHWNTPAYFDGHSHLTADAAALLRRAGVKLVGIDSLNIDSTADGERPVHSELLGHEILIVEHVTNLASLPEAPLTFTAVPVKVKGMGTFPVRAFCRVGG